MRERALLASLAALSACFAFTSPAFAKRTGIHSPGGREIYGEDEVFREVVEQKRRNFVVEVVTGIAPEGNLGLLLGVLNRPLRGVEFYAGVGWEATPAVNFPLSARYWFDVFGLRPYVSVGYTYRSLGEIGLVSHNAFAEAGYKWQFHQTYHLTLGVGVRRPLVVLTTDGSPLNGPTIDRRLLDEQLDESKNFVPTASLRFSHAF
jgi:hypothetical protein